MFEFKKSSKFKTRFAADIETIKGYLCDIGNTYLLICYRIWEINQSKSYSKAGYKNIVEACENELGFKKSTTYNMLNVVKTYGADSKGVISYNQLCTYSKFTYSQLVEMLSLGSAQRAEVTPDMSVSAIRMLKKSDEKDETETFQTSGKPSELPESATSVSTSGTPSGEDAFNIYLEYGHLYCDFGSEFVKIVDDLEDKFDSLLYDLGGSLYPHCHLGEDDIYKYSPDEIEHLFNSFMSIYRQAYDSFYNQLETKTKDLETKKKDVV